MKLTSARIRDLSYAVDEFSKATRDHGVNLCAYGGIDIDVGDGEYMRLEWDTDAQAYYVTETFR